MKEALKQQVFDANIELVKNGLVILTWGNVSGIDREDGIVAIKPSGVDYAKLTPEDIVLVDRGNGEGNQGGRNVLVQEGTGHGVLTADGGSVQTQHT